MRKTSLVILFAILTVSLLTAKTIPLPELTNPAGILVEDDQIYITQFPEIFIYSLEDFKLKKTFGKRGEGPAEFKGYARISVYPDYIFVNSIGKILFFTREGEYIKELKSPEPQTRYKPLGKKYVGRRETVEKGVYYGIISFYDENLNKIKEVYREKGALELGKYFNPLIDPCHFDILGDKIITNAQDVLLVFNSEGEKISSIKHDYRKVKVTEAFKKDIVESFKKGDRKQYEMLKDILQFPEYWRGIWAFRVLDKKIYVGTHFKKDNKLEYFIN
ncbi:MAG: hypothetical protein PVH61_03605 [Candidatus Aminicenantes bacterium]|jgi:hypothetical protein